MNRFPAWWVGVVLACGSLLSSNSAHADEPTDKPATAPAADTQPTTNPAALSVEALTEQVKKSVAVITSASRDGRRDGLGTGFVIASDGLIATNYHVVGEGRAVRVQLADGRSFDAAAVQASDRQLDLAILKIDAKDLPALTLGDSAALKQGQSVVALGNPQGLKLSVVAGVVSGMREMEGRPMIQVAIPIEPGNSGGPLVDAQGRVVGVMTMKSLVTPNLGFALAIDALKPLVAKPNPIPMSRWLTIGALDPREWQPLFGARWRQRAGRITVDGPGNGFGGRSLCLWQLDVPEAPLEMSVNVQLGDESGAAGLAFCCDGGDKHYGFYPTGGRLRLTRFEGPDVLSWNILYDHPHKQYLPGEWNTLRVRLEQGKVACFVNGEKVVELEHDSLGGGRVGLVKFRETQAQFKNFRLGHEAPTQAMTAEEAARIIKLTDALEDRAPADAGLVETLAAEGPNSAAALRPKADELDRRSKQLRQLAQATHEHRVLADLAALFAGPEEEVDLVRAGLLVARLDNDEVDVAAYAAEFDRMAADVQAKCPEGTTDQAKLDALRKYLFEENGFHGSRGDYYSRSNSYLNEVLDDREGLPITLSVVYLELARRIGLKVEGVGLPGHFVVRYVPAEGEPQLIDVFEGAVPVSREEAAKRIRENSDRELTDDDLKATTKRAIVIRMLHNLLGLSSNDTPAANRYLNGILALDPTSAQHRWLRAIVRYRVNDRKGAAEDVAWLMEHKPEGIDLHRVFELKRALDSR